MTLSVGIDLGGTNIKAALIHRDNGILEHYSVPTNAESGLEATLGRLADTVKKVSAGAKQKISGIGIGAPGMISSDRRSVFNPPNLPGWDQVPLAEELTRRTGLACLVENDANLMALGSARYGSGKAFRDFIMITLGTGVGGGIILGNNIYRGPSGAAGELGHVSIDYRGAQCNSTVPGAIEAYLGQRFLSRRAASEIEKHPENDLYTRFSGNFSELEPRHLTEAAKAGNNLAAEILKDAGRKLGYAMVNYVHILDIRVFVVSGGVAGAGDLILKPAYDAAIERLMPPFRNGFSILPETLGNEAALLGAGTLALENL
jgi:glucokinase